MNKQSLFTLKFSTEQKEDLVYNLLKKTFINQEACLKAAKAFIKYQDKYTKEDWSRLATTKTSHKRGKTLVQIEDMLNKPINKEIDCIACRSKVNARLTNGKEIYPHRPDLYEIPFWKCDTCKNYVGCHHRSKQRTKPLGCIATPEIFQKRKIIHAIIDPIWKSGKMPRKLIYIKLSKVFGREYHTGDIRSLEEADKIIEAARNLTT